MSDFETILSEYGLTQEKYESCIADIQDKINGNVDMDWQDIVDTYNLPMTNTTLRKACSSMPFGCKFVLDYFLAKNNETAYRVSKETGIATATLTEWKNGNYEPKVEKLMLIADHFGVPVTVFLDAKKKQEVTD